MIKYLIGIYGALGGMLVGGWLMLAPFALAYQSSGAEWTNPTHVDFWSGLAILVVSLIGLVAYALGLIGELRRRGIIGGETAQAEQIPATGALAGSGAAPAVGTPMNGMNQSSFEDVERLLMPLINAMLEDMQDQRQEGRRQEDQRQEDQWQEGRRQESRSQYIEQQEEQLREDRRQDQLQDDRLEEEQLQEERLQEERLQEEWREDLQLQEERLQEERLREEQRLREKERQEEQLREEQRREEQRREEQRLREEERLREEQRLREEKRQEERRRWEDGGVGWSATPRWRLDRGRR